MRGSGFQTCKRVMPIIKCTENALNQEKNHLLHSYVVSRTSRTFQRTHQNIKKLLSKLTAIPTRGNHLPTSVCGVSAVMEDGKWGVHRKHFQSTVEVTNVRIPLVISAVNPLRNLSPLTDFRLFRFIRPLEIAILLVVGGPLALKVEFFSLNFRYSIVGIQRIF